LRKSKNSGKANGILKSGRQTENQNTLTTIAEYAGKRFMKQKIRRKVSVILTATIGFVRVVTLNTFDKRQHNKSMDVRAKQRLCYGVVLFPLACVDSVLPHVISSVRRFLVTSNVAANGVK